MTWSLYWWHSATTDCWCLMIAQAVAVRTYGLIIALTTVSQCDTTVHLSISIHQTHTHVLSEALTQSVNVCCCMSEKVQDPTLVLTCSQYWLSTHNDAHTLLVSDDSWLLCVRMV